jgi:hypothetical protein
LTSGVAFDYVVGLAVTLRSMLRERSIESL